MPVVAGGRHAIENFNLPLGNRACSPIIYFLLINAYLCHCQKDKTKATLDHNLKTILMKHIILLNILFFFFLNLSGQNLISIDPNPAEAEFNVDLSDFDLDLEVHTTVKNLTSDTLLLRWERFEMTSPDEWDTQVCDPNACYLPSVNTNFDPDLQINEPVILLPDSSFELIFHFLPNGEGGEGAFDLDFSLISDPDNVIETATFKARVNALVSSISKSPDLKGVRVFPNPTADYIELTNTESVDQMVVYNLLGRPVRFFPVYNGRRYRLNDLPDGIYLVSLVSHRDGILKTLRVSKRSYHP